MNDPRTRVITLAEPVEHLFLLGGSMAEICCAISKKPEQLVSHLHGGSLALVTCLSVLNEAEIEGLGFVNLCEVSEDRSVNPRVCLHSFTCISVVSKEYM